VTAATGAGTERRSEPLVGATAAPRRIPTRRAPLWSRPAAVWGRRRALGLLVSRDLKVRYAGSWLGWVWTVLEPLLMAGAYWVVFTQIFSRSAGEEPYIVFLLAGLLPWTWFNGALSEAARALRTDGKLIRSTNVPRELWVLRVVLSKGVEFLFSLPVLALFVVATGADVDWRIVLVVPATLLLAMLLTGIGLLLAPLVVLVRDLERIVRIVLRLAFYASPVVYAVRDVPPAWEWLFALNPLAGIFELFRAGFFPELLDPSRVALSVGVSVVVLVLGWAVFARLERTVLKEL